MRLIICMDDTDNKESRGTGHLVEEFRSRFADEGWGKTEPISRHQLFVHPDVPYTSHNSTMCFTARVESGLFNRIEGEAREFLLRESAPGSDPGLAMADLDKLPSFESLIRFGRRAQSEVLSKEAAYGLASEMGVSLSEHGGTGDGVIGALAGIGLRLSGNDGRIRGKLKGLKPGEARSVGELLSHEAVDSVLFADPSQVPADLSPRSLNAFLEEKGREADSSEPVVLRDKIKCIRRFGRSVFLVCRSGDSLVNWTKDELKVF